MYIRNTDGIQQLQHAGPCRARRESSMQGQHLTDLFADGVQGVQGRHRLLKDHGDLVAAHRPHLACAEGPQVLAIEQDLLGPGIAAIG